MKLMHISDLHLGKRISDFSMIDDQKGILKKIIETVNEQKPDVILIAGDIYDRSVPSTEAMEILYKEICAAYPDYKIMIAPDVDVSATEL